MSAISLGLGLTLAAAALAVGAGPVRQAPSTNAQSVVGERLIYDVKFGPLKVGTATMEVIGMEDVRGHMAWHTLFTVKGGTFFYKVDDVMESWFDTSFSSIRFRQQYAEGSRRRLAVYEFFPEHGTYMQAGKEEQPTVEQPLDDASFVYFTRALPLTVGESYTLPRYFIPDRNPVKLDVIRKERIKVPAGTFDAVVIRPTLKTKGIFSEGGRAELWFSADSNHVLLQMTSHLSFGTLSLHLRERREGVIAGMSPRTAISVAAIESDSAR